MAADIKRRDATDEGQFYLCLLRFGCRNCGLLLTYGYFISIGIRSKSPTRNLNSTSFKTSLQAHRRQLTIFVLDLCVIFRGWRPSLVRRSIQPLQMTLEQPIYTKEGISDWLEEKSGYDGVTPPPTSKDDMQRRKAISISACSVLVAESAVCC